MDHKRLREFAGLPEETLEEGLSESNDLLEAVRFLAINLKSLSSKEKREFSQLLSDEYKRPELVKVSNLLEDVNDKFANFVDPSA